MDIIDISRELLHAPVYPGDPPPYAQWVQQIGENESECNLSVLHTCVHTGTHMDAPLHFIPGAADAEQIAPEACIGPCKVIAVPPGEITGDFVNRYFPPESERLLLKGAGQAYFMDSTAEEAAQLPLRLIGTDALSVGSKGQQLRPHRAFLANGIAVLEGLDLSGVAPGEYFLFAAPLRLAGLEGAPARAFLVKDYIFWSKG